MTARAPGAHSLLGWLPAVVPADARSFRAADRELAETLIDAGATLSERAPDVEFAAAGSLRGDARHAVVSIDSAQPEGGRLLIRAPRRLFASGEARVRALAARRALRSRGYRVTSTVLWDIDHLLFVPGVRDSRRGRPLASVLPERALVTGSRDIRAPTILQAVAADAAAALGTPLEHGWPLARQAMVVVVADQGVLRVAVGPGRSKLERQGAALDALAAADPPAELTGRLPWALREGRTGLADWSLDTRLPGGAPSSRLSPVLLDDCINFLVMLHGVQDERGPRTSLAAAAEVLATVCSADTDADAVRRLGDALESTLADVPRGFGHGDFWTRNLLATGDRLTGVVDWDGAGPGRLPLLDLLHLRLSAHRDQTREYLGTALVDHLLPWARAGGDEIARTYGRRIGVELPAPRLEALVAAYWLDRVASEVAMFSDLAKRPLWIRTNVEDVIRALTRRMLGAPSGATPRRPSHP